MADEIVDKETESTEVDYVAAIKELKDNTVPKNQYAKLKEENKKLLQSLINGESIGGAEASSVPDVDMNGLRDLGDQLKEKLGEGVVVLASAKDGKVSLLAMVTPAAMAQGAHAGNLIKAIAGLVGGGGGGRPNMAQAGGKNPEGVEAALAKVSEVLEGQIK